MRSLSTSIFSGRIFKTSDLDEAIRIYSTRQRRFGA